MTWKVFKNDFTNFLEDSFFKLLKRDLSVESSKSEKQFNRIKTYKLFIDFIRVLRVIFRLVSRSSSTVKNNMIVLSESTNELKTSSEMINDTISEFNREIEFSTKDMFTVSEYANSIKNRTKSMIFNNTQITESSFNIQKKVNDGAQSMNIGVSLINELLEQNQELQLTISDLWKNFSSMRMSMLELSKLSEQSRMLALNAEIEAAHAGEHGKGFAIVAQQMGMLSNTSSSNAKNIVDRLKDLQEGAKLSEINIASSVEFANEAKELIEKATNYYNQIKDSIKEVMNESENFQKSFHSLGGEIEIIDGLIKKTETLMIGRSKRVKTVLEKTEKQRQISNTIHESTQDTLKISRTLNSLISLFTIPGFRDNSEIKTEYEKLLDNVLNLRGIFVSNLFSKSTQSKMDLQDNFSFLQKEIMNFEKNTLDQKSEGMKTAMNSFLAQSNTVYQLILTNDHSSAKTLFENEFKPTFNQLVSSILEILSIMEEEK